MAILYAAAVALFIVGGQVFWKLAVTQVAKTHTNIATVDGMLKVLFSAPLFFGVALYGIATLAYIVLLSKYKYYQIQSIVVGGSLIFTLLVAYLFFKEQPSIVNIAGVILIALGALLVVR